jgi:hypothetical protein
MTIGEQTFISSHRANLKIERETVGVRVPSPASNIKKVLEIIDFLGFFCFAIYHNC